MNYFFLGFADELCKLAKDPSKITEIHKQNVSAAKNRPDTAIDVSEVTEHLFPVGKQSTHSGIKYETTPKSESEWQWGTPTKHTTMLDLRPHTESYGSKPGSITVPYNKKNQLRQTYGPGLRAVSSRHIVSEK